MRKCPDCKIDMDLFSPTSDDVEYGDLWKCPKCGLEIEEGDEDYEE